MGDHGPRPVKVEWNQRMKDSHVADPSGLSLDDLLLLAALDIEQSGQPLTFERLVANCFELYPSRFSLRGYPHWPDSNVVNKTWLRARTDKGWLVGSVRQGFRLTPEGRRHAARLANGAAGGRPRRTLDRRTREGRLLEAMRSTKAFKVFQTEGDDAKFDLADVADSLLASEDTSIKALSRNCAQFRAAAALYDDQEATTFLDHVEELLEDHKNRARAGYSGGMMQRKEMSN